ncbi:MAG: AI-2E family transporter, partial [Actinomycetota bacterium]|nr:AI-2E family transporter [Actinomycetota bacterium]
METGNGKGGDLILQYRSILRVVITVVASVSVLWLVYLLREPIGFLVLALFVAVFLSAPIEVLSRRMPQNLAIVIVYLGVILVPLLVALIMIPPAINGGAEIVEQLPGYSESFQTWVDENDQLREWDEDFGLTDKAEEFAASAGTGLLSDAPGLLASIGSGAANLILQVFVVIVFSLF